MSADGIYLSTPKDCSIPADVLDRDKGIPVTIQNQFPVQDPTSCGRSMPPYCASPPEVFTSPFQNAEVVSVPGTEYSTMEHPGFPNATVSAPRPANPPVQDFYTCVQLMRDSGEVHLVPCLPSAYCQEFPVFPSLDAAKKKKKKEEEEDKRKRLTEYQARKSSMKAGGESEKSDAADPLLPVGLKDSN